MEATAAILICSSSMVCGRSAISLNPLMKSLRYISAVVKQGDQREKAMGSAQQILAPRKVCTMSSLLSNMWVSHSPYCNVFTWPLI